MVNIQIGAPLTHVATRGMKFRITGFVMMAIVVMFGGMPVAAADSIIVKFKPGISQARIDGLNASLGASIIRRFELIKAVHIRIPEAVTMERALTYYRSSGLVVYAEANSRVHTMAPASQPETVHSALSESGKATQPVGPSHPDVGASRTVGCPQ